jgi:hypothetical protein
MEEHFLPNLELTRGIDRESLDCVDDLRNAALRVKYLILSRKLRNDFFLLSLIGRCDVDEASSSDPVCFTRCLVSMKSVNTLPLRV